MTGQPVTTLRWHVRLEHVREPRFGERGRSTLRWAVRAYFPRPNRFKAYLHPNAAPPYFNTLAAAIAHARKLCAQRYGSTTPTRSTR